MLYIIYYTYLFSYMHMHFDLSDDVEGDQDESELLKVNKTLLRRARGTVQKR